MIIKDCARHFVLKLYRHEASRGLFATAELLVLYACPCINDALLQVAAVADMCFVQCTATVGTNVNEDSL